MSMMLFGLVLITAGIFLSLHHGRDEYTDIWALVMFVCGVMVLILRALIYLWVG